MAVSSAMGFDVQKNLPQIGGGVVGVGVPVALRETMDTEVGPLVGEPGSMLARVSRPSSAWGLGAGGLTGLLYALGVGPDSLQDFYLAHSLTAIPTGAASAFLPKGTGGTTAGTSSRTRQRMTQESVGGNSANGEFGPSGGRNAETAPAN